MQIHGLTVLCAVNVHAPMHAEKVRAPGKLKYCNWYQHRPVTAGTVVCAHSPLTELPARDGGVTGDPACTAMIAGGLRLLAVTAADRAGGSMNARSSCALKASLHVGGTCDAQRM